MLSRTTVAAEALQSASRGKIAATKAQPSANSTTPSASAAPPLGSTSYASRSVPWINGTVSCGNIFLCANTAAKQSPLANARIPSCHAFNASWLFLATLVPLTQVPNCGHLLSPSAYILSPLPFPSAPSKEPAKRAHAASHA
eukprot:CAMPEP_0172768604 /NCGR_PEP_ID=MMETSP1074-20121228/185107_1 /TAXON_ID=2916 /ORGANISM="Ceratium fusus, Strain PA161109" /LENGTH=141 /DNA_ID=CAMNT_0013604041 /DNA_START=123 /DNA_END=548 /DNA_ORIENTATION=+